MDTPDYDHLLRRLVAIAASQDAINTRLEATIGQLIAFNVEQRAINAEQRDITVRLEKLLERLIHPGGNGHQTP